MDTEKLLLNALREIELLLVLDAANWTEREARIYSIACAAVNLAQGDEALEAEKDA